MKLSKLHLARNKTHASQIAREVRKRGKKAYIGYAPEIGYGVIEQEK
jgi:hypothetical protein